MFTDLCGFMMKCLLSRFFATTTILMNIRLDSFRKRPLRATKPNHEVLPEGEGLFIDLYLDEEFRTRTNTPRELLELFRENNYMLCLEAVLKIHVVILFYAHSAPATSSASLELTRRLLRSPLIIQFLVERGKRRTQSVLVMERLS